jgi:hypothetical protein
VAGRKPGVADLSLRLGYASEAVISDQDNWEFSGADEAKAEIRAPRARSHQQKWPMRLLNAN